MGMFDSFIPSEKIICPKCNDEIENADNKPYKCVLQSKDLECMSDLFKQDEPLRIERPNVNLIVKDGWIEAHTICDKCDSYVQFKIIIENGMWTRTEKWDELL